jgi:hypothetical protein
MHSRDGGGPADGPRRATGGDDPAMLKTAARFLLLRVLPRRILPIVTVVEALLFVRSIRKRSQVRVNAPARSRTAPPAPLDTAPSTAPASDRTPLAR